MTAIEDQVIRQVYGKFDTRPVQNNYIPVGTLQVLALIGFCFAFGTNLFQAAFAGGTGSSSVSERSPAVYAAFLICYAVIFLLCLRSLKQIFLTSTSFIVMFLLISYPVISVLWSQAPATTLQRSIAIIGCSFLGVYLASAFPLAGLIKILANASCLMTVAHVFISLAVPSRGVMDASWEATGVYAGAWRGLTTHKNMLGAYSSLSALILIFAAINVRGKLQWAYIGCFLLSLLSLFQARSTTAILILLFCLLVLITMKLCQLMPNLIWPCMFIIVLFTPLLFASIFTESFLAEIFALLDKNPQMSGRFPLWDLAMSRVQERYWLGYGHEAFWHPDDPYVKYIEETLKYPPHYSHNGVIETLLNGGIGLLSLLLLTYIIAVYQSIRLLILKPDTLIVIFPICYLVLFFFANLTESHVLARNSLMWTLFVAVPLATALELRNLKNSRT